MIDDEVLQFLSDCKVLKIQIPVSAASPLSLDAVLCSCVPPFLELQFPPEMLRLADIDLQGDWQCTCDNGIRILAVRARLASLPETGRVRLTVVSATFQSCARRHERVDAEVHLNYRSEEEVLPLHRSAVRQSVNISGCGICFRAAVVYRRGERVEVQMTLPTQGSAQVRCVGRVIRVNSPQTDQRCETALEIVEIGPADLDRLITFCMAEQFRKMHSKVHVFASILSPSMEKR